MKVVTSLTEIGIHAKQNQVKNDAFVTSLKQLNSNWIDDRITELNSQIEPLIDCTSCGNCCKSLMINVEETEVQTASVFLGLSEASFKNQYIEQSESGRMVVNTIPCHFLSDNKCTIYLARFGGCKEFPGLHLPNLRERLFTVMMHYERCPIIFNVIENLKEQLFEKENKTV